MKKRNSMNNKDDEKIRKELIEFIKGCGAYSQEYIDWLEKQGKKEPVTCPICGWEIEKQGELADKVEPKFHEGEWIITPDNQIKQIKSISFGNYYFTDGSLYNIIDVDNKGHIWTIQNAKDGDVIFYDDGWTCIFKNIHGIWYSSYCFITADGEFHTGYEQHAVNAKLNGNANPATKEQRDTLFKKMKEACYEWDADNKKLNKIIAPIFNIGDVLCDKSCTTLNKDTQPNFEIVDIRNGMYICDKGSFPISQQNEYELVTKRIEQKNTPKHKVGETIYYNSFGEVKSMIVANIVTDSTDNPMYEDENGSAVFEKDLIEQESIAWSEEDNLQLQAAIDICKSSGHTITSDWLESLKDRVQPQAKQEWSKEDEEYFNSIAYALSVLLVDPSFDKIKLEHTAWFKSLKDRVQFKQ